ncbi:MAG TPA: N-acetylgalactosamine-6-sulfatase [Bacteroidales bacterium]|nr:N-acetylgalactosamine-6-sulfatase [Bacteroidales bacterium]
MNKLINVLKNSILGIGTVHLIASVTGCSGGIRKDNINNSKPNIIFILADDLGYGDLGCYGQTRIETPNIDKLASAGMVFTQHYAGSPVSAPSRCVLLTGIHSGKAQIRSNDPWPERGDVQNYLAMFADSTLEGNRPLKAGTVTIGTMLQSAGYKTAIVGKWGLGAPATDGLPNKQGFDFFYGYVCQRQAHTYYPLHLWKNEHRVYLNNDTIVPHNTPLPHGADPYDLKNYALYTLNDYSPDLMFNEITKFVEGNKNNPFFLYWATTIPHLPLQAPQNWVDHYVNKFGDEEPSEGGGYFPCRYPRATYAAMISYLDDQVGKLVQQLKDSGLYENTIIIFTSDNGPIGPYVPWFNSAGPFRPASGYVKGSLHEGGIRVPMIAVWPGVIKAGSVSGHISVFQDVMPTLAEIAGVRIPDDACGISFLPCMKGKKQKEHPYLYWEYPGSNGQINIRTGNFKALSTDVKNSTILKWQLFDLEKDPQEVTDISSSHPQIINRVNQIVTVEHALSLNKNWQFRVLGDY